MRVKPYQSIIHILISAAYIFVYPAAAYAGDNERSARRDGASKADTAKIAEKKPIELHEVVVTARESRAAGTAASYIGRSAMEHLQPTSLSDLMSLLPGGTSKDPQLGKANTIELRETGVLGATGSKVDNPDYAISSLGTLFVVDGAPVNTDASMQSIGASVSDAANTTNRGVDMRTIATDNIESVEIVRGIPSVEYGNLTSGMVNITRSRRAQPLRARFKADEYSKLFYVGKGLSFADDNVVVNADLGWLDAKPDPRDNLGSYKRLTASLRSNALLQAGSLGSLRLSAAADYTSSFDDAKTDPDLSYGKINEYSSHFNRVSFTSGAVLMRDPDAALSRIALNVALSYESDRLERRLQVAPQRASVAPTTMTEGVSDGHYLLREYISDYACDGKPFTAFAKLSARGKRVTGVFTHGCKGGLEWNMSKNYGKGQLYDLERPLSAAWTTRPRAFSDIPALHNIGAYAEDDISAPVGGSRLNVTAGVRAVALAGLDSRYYLSGRVYLDPRVNMSWQFPGLTVGGDLFSVTVGGGYGLTTRMPTADYLYPQEAWHDFIQLNYYDTSSPYEHSRVSLRTYKNDAVNYDLRAARNRKAEVRLSTEWRGNTLTVIYFDERMRSGFRYSNVYAPYAFRNYDASAIDPSVLTGPPSLDNLPYTDRVVLDGHRIATNGTRIDKRGIEFQLQTARWRALRTSLTVTGAWFHSVYSNSQMLYDPVSDVVAGKPVSESFIGVYDSNDGRVNDCFNTNFMFDTQIPRWGLIFSTAVQCEWWVETTRLPQQGRPVKYLTVDGQLHDFTDEAMRQYPELKYLLQVYNDDVYRTQRIAPAVYLNLKATKEIGRHLRVAVFVDRMIDYLPDYKSNGLTVRRSSDAYFGMEINLKL